MQVLFKSRHPQATELRDLTERRVRFVLRRLGWLVPRAEVQMSDVNGPRGSIDTRSYYQVLTPGLLPPGFFKNKHVLVGRSLRTATELNASQADMFNSPFAWLDGSDRLMPGVELHANLVANPEFSDWLVQRTPSRRWGDVAELAGAAVFLASDAASFVNGHILYVDGGITASL